MIKSAVQLSCLAFGGIPSMRGGRYPSWVSYLPTTQEYCKSKLLFLISLSFVKLKT